MNTVHQKTIKLIDIVPTKMISSRDIVATFLPIIKKYSKHNIVLNFSKIQFISRSAAHEILRLKSKYQNIVLENATSEVAGILRTVAASMALPKDTTSKFKPKKTTLKALLEY